MKTLIYFLILCTFQVAVAANFNPSSRPLDFSMWKQQKIRAAYERYTQSLKAHDNEQVRVEKIKKAKIANINYHVLQYSRKLSHKDYLDMYIAEKYPNDIRVLNQVVSQLSKPEITKIIADYQHQARRKNSLSLNK